MRLYDLPSKLLCRVLNVELKVPLPAAERCWWALPATTDWTLCQVRSLLLLPTSNSRSPMRTWFLDWNARFVVGEGNRCRCCAPNRAWFLVLDWTARFRVSEGITCWFLPSICWCKSVRLVDFWVLLISILFMPSWFISLVCSLFMNFRV